MEEELLDYLFQWAQSDGFKKSKDDFANLIKTNDDVFNYAYKFAEADGYKKGPDAFGKLLGRGISNKEEVIEKKPVENINVEEKSISSIPKKDSEVKSPPSIPVEMSGITPVTEKTEVKSVDTPSDKMVIKSEKKEEEKDKVITEPIKIEPIKIESVKFETKEGQIQVEVPEFAIPELKKKYKPYGEKGPDVYYSEHFDQFIIKDGNERTIVSKGSPKYNEIENKLVQLVGATKEGKGKCTTPPFIGCSPNKTALNEFLYYKGDVEANGYRSTDEGGLIEELDGRKKTIENKGESLWSIYNNNSNDGIGDIYYANEEPPKSDRFVIYKPYGDDKTLIYDKESGAILKQLDDKAPIIDANKEASPIYDTKGNIIKKQSNAKDIWRNYSKNNPNEGLTVWKGFEIDHPEYKELKAIIEGIEYKKQKGTKNIFVPLSPDSDPTALPDWMKK